jgi:hypothetical protein
VEVIHLIPAFFSHQEDFGAIPLNRKIASEITARSAEKGRVEIRAKPGGGHE